MTDNGKRADDGGGFLAPPVAVMLTPVDIRYLLEKPWEYTHRDERIINALKEAIGDPT